MVSNSALAAVCIQAGLHEHLIFESFTLANNIQFYAENLKAKQAEEYQAAVNEDRMPGQYWLEVEPPKVRIWTIVLQIHEVHSSLRRRCQTLWNPSSVPSTFLTTFPRAGWRYSLITF